MKKNHFRPASGANDLLKKAVTFALTLFILFPVSSAVQAGTHKNRDFPTVAISNFGKVNDHFYRGSQPEGAEYQQLAALGIKTVIDLRDDAKDFAKPLAEGAGLHYINFPMSDRRYPAPDVAQRFLELANNPANWPIYVHCAGGRHRTGIMTAVYRISVEGWDIDRAYREMKDYDFYTAWGHKAMKDYIFDYAREVALKHSPTGQQKLAASN
ncbi:MAG: tyrosine-protein phosphatase [Blastocatellia bacterium]